MLGLSGVTEAQRLGMSESDYRTFGPAATLRCPIPPMLNEQINLARTHWAKSAQVKKQWTRDIAFMCAGLPKFLGPVWLSFKWQPKKWPNLDADNCVASAKYILDSLVQAGIIQDDSLKVIQSPYIHYFEKGNNEVIVTISAKPFSGNG